MTEWCLAHPWMTFFVALQLVSVPRLVIRWRSPKTVIKQESKP